MDERAWCPACNGTGQAAVVLFQGRVTDSSPCLFCSKTGRVWKQDADAWLRRKAEQESKQLPH
jgi:DnaJ-class molecular chaperone